MAQYRYPGSPPFADTDVDRLVFRGRDVEIDAVLHSILSSPLLVLYAISGTGKTSLMNAGVMQHLRDRGLWPVTLRLNDPSRLPLELIAEQIQTAAETSRGITVEHGPLSDAGTCLWDYLAGLEVWKGNELLQPVLVFDQLEELFTLGWDDAARREFIAEFGEVVRRHHNPDAKGHQPTRSRLPPPNIKFVFMIREDSLGELDAFAVDVPQIMRTRFRLVGLDPDQAEEAIRQPALIEDPRLQSHQFSYTDEAATTLIDFLRRRTDHGRVTKSATVEPSQLQIVCQHIERSQVSNSRGSTLEEMYEVTKDDLGGEDGLNQVLRDFYGREIESFPQGDRSRIRELCETGLISHNSRRLSLEQHEITDRYKVSKDLLDELVERRLLRADPRVGSVYYELAHDTLVEPILAYRQKNPTKDIATRVMAGSMKFFIEPLVWLSVLALVAFTIYGFGLALDIFEPTEIRPESDIVSGLFLGPLSVGLLVLIAIGIRWSRLKWLTS